MGEPAPSPSAGLGSIQVQARYAPRSMVVSLEFYFDESGKEPASPRFFIAGVAASASRWLKMRKHWHATLNAAPSIGYFKMHEAVTKTGQFLGWDEPDVDAKAMALSALIDEYASYHLAHDCVKADYDEARRRTSTLEVPKRLDNHYLPCFLDALFAVASHMEEKPDRSHAKPLVTFDRHDETEFEAAAILRLVKRSSKQKPKSVAFDVLDKWIDAVDFRGDDKHMLPLQAADIVAWHYNALGKDDSEAELRRPTRLKLARLPGNGSSQNVGRLVNWRRLMADYAANDTEWQRPPSRKELRKMKRARTSASASRRPSSSP